MPEHWLRMLLWATVVASLTHKEAGAQSIPTRSVHVADSVSTTPRIGSRVTIAGRVSLGWGVLDTAQLNVYVQDSSGSVLVDADRPTPFLHLAVGDSVFATGIIGRERGQAVLDDATITLVPAARRAPAPVILDALLPAHLREPALAGRLVILEGIVASRNIGRGDHMLTLGDTVADGNYVRVIEDESGNARLRLARFSIGDRLRVTGVLVRWTSRATGMVRYTIYPRSATDVAPIGLTARTKRTALWATGDCVALLILGGWIRHVHRRQRSQRSRAERELREDAARYRLLVDRAPVGIVVHEKGRIVFANAAFTHLVGAGNPSELQGKHLGELLHSNDQSELIAGLFCTRENGIAAPRFQTQLLRLDGTKADVEITDSPVMHAGTSCVQAIVYDVTERTQTERALAETEAQLRQAQKLEAVGQLAGGVAHDFNNLLTIIKGNAEFLLRGCDGCQCIPTEAAEIDRAADRAAALTYQLLAFSRKQVIKPRVIEVDALVRELEGMLRRLVPESIEQQFTLGADGGRVSADPGQLEQAIVNLVVNARDAMPQGGLLAVKTANVRIGKDQAGDEGMIPPGAYVCVTLTDTGVGMDETTRRRVFEPFFTTKEQGKGTGLGLSMVYGIVKQIEGHIFLHTLPGMGTTFRIYLPRVNAAASEKAAFETANAPPREGKETILVVEDEPMIRRLIARALERSGYEVLLAGNGAEALTLVGAHAGRLDLLLTDVIMPVLSGAETAAHLSKLRHGLRVLYMSGYTDDHMAKHGVLAPDVELMQKPFSPKDLLDRVRRILDAPLTKAA